MGPTDVPDPAGGETGSFTPTPCGWVSTKIPIDIDAAIALGYPVRETIARLERPVDAVLRWTAENLPAWQTMNGSWEASDYVPLTRVRAEQRVTGIQHWRPNPQWCDGTTCQRDDAPPVDQATCTHWLYFDLATTLATDDGAVDLEGTGLAVLRSDDLGQDFAGYEVNGEGWSDFRGRMQFPGVLSPQVVVVYSAFVFTANETTGYVSATIMTPRDQARDAASLSAYEKWISFQYRGVSIRGYWPRD